MENTNLSGISPSARSCMAIFSVLCISAFVCVASSAKENAANVNDSMINSTPVETKAVNRSSNVLTPPAVFQGDVKSVFADKHPRVILVLSGGAGKSVAQIGAIRSLEKHHIPIDAVVGTSMGATIGALYCSGMKIDEIEKLFLDDTLHHSIMPGIIAGKILHPFAKITYLVSRKPYLGASKGTAYLNLLREHLPPTFEQLEKPFAAVATNITDGQTSVFTSGNLPQAVLASCSIPLIFRPVEIEGKLYVDGGLKANLPAAIAQKMGDGVVVSVLCDNAIKPVSNSTFKSKTAFAMRVVDIMLAAVDHTQANSSDVLIYPNVDAVPGTTKDRQLLEQGIKAGEAAADQAIPQITSKLEEYYAQEAKKVAKKKLEKNTPM